MTKKKILVLNTNQPKQATCPICRAKFANKAALTQHMLSTHVENAVNGPHAAVVTHDTRTRRTATKQLVHPAVPIPRPKAIANPGFSGKFGTSVGPFNYKSMLLSNLGSTPEGRAWAYAAIHPCGEGEIIGSSIGNLDGMPDTMTGSVVTPVYRSENVIVFNGQLFPTPIEPTAAGTWGVDVVIPPIPEIDYIYRLKFDPTGAVSDWVVVRTANVEITPADLSVTPQIPATGVTMATLGYGDTRCIGLGHTFTLDSNSVTNQGRVIVGQMQGQWDVRDISAIQALYNVSGADKTLVAASNDAWPVYSNASSMRLHSLSVPTDEKVVVQACPAAYQAPAKDGAYVVTKFSTPLTGHHFKPTGSNDVFEVATIVEAIDTPAWTPPPASVGSIVSQALPLTALCINGASKSGTLNNAEKFSDGSGYSTSGTDHLPMKMGTSTVAPLGDIPVNARLVHPFVSEPSGMMTAVVLFRNLVVGPAVGGTSSIRVKGRNHIEAIANANNGGTGPFSHHPAPYDEVALKNVIVAGKLMADAYPASYNESGAILDDVFHTLTSVVSPLAKAVGSLGIPVVSDVAKFLS